MTILEMAAKISQLETEVAQLTENLNRLVLALTSGRAELFVGHTVRAAGLSPTLYRPRPTTESISVEQQHDFTTSDNPNSGCKCG